MQLRPALLTGALVALAVAAPAQTLEIHNPVGGVHVKVESGPRLHIEGLGTNRKVTPEDTKITRIPGRTIFTVNPPTTNRSNWT